MHLTPKNFFRSIESPRYSKHLGAKIFEFVWILDFLCPLKVALEVLHDRVLGSLGRRLLMTSTQEPNTMAPQSALCICSRKWKAKWIVPIYFGTRTSEFCLRRNHFFFITGVRVKFRFERLQNKLRSSTFDNVNCDWITAWSFELRALYNISSDDGEDLFADELLVY